MGHLKLRGSTWHWRLSVPPDLRPHVGRYELSRSTGTGDKRLAQRRSMKWTAEAKERFDELRGGKVASHAEMVAVARRVLAEGLRDLKPKPGQRLDNFDSAVDAQMDNWRGVIDPEYMLPDTKVVTERVDSIIRQYGLALPKAVPQYDEFTVLVARAMVQGFVIAWKRATGDYGAHPWDDLSDGGLDNVPPRSMGFLVRA